MQRHSYPRRFTVQRQTLSCSTIYCAGVVLTDANGGLRECGADRARLFRGRGYHAATTLVLHAPEGVPGRFIVTLTASKEQGEGAVVVGQRMAQRTPSPTSQRCRRSSLQSPVAVSSLQSWGELGVSVSIFSPVGLVAELRPSPHHSPLTEPWTACSVNAADARVATHHSVVCTQLETGVRVMYD